MKLIHETRERKWYLVKEWTTEAGLLARIHQCVWSDLVKSHAMSLHDHYCGYVQKKDTDTKKYYDHPDINVHGGVTHEGPLFPEAEGEWVGFDMAHIGDENRPGPIEYAEKECEDLARQMIT